MKQNTALAGIVLIVHNQREANVSILARHSLKTLRLLQGTYTEAARRAFYGGDAVGFAHYEQQGNELTEAILRKELKREEGL